MRRIQLVDLADKVADSVAEGMDLESLQEWVYDDLFSLYEKHPEILLMRAADEGLIGEDEEIELT